MPDYYPPFRKGGIFCATPFGVGKRNYYQNVEAKLPLNKTDSVFQGRSFGTRVNSCERMPLAGKRKVLDYFFR
jgi:hypothetical protein